MKLFSYFVLIFYVSLIHASGSYDRTCGQDPSNIWLDVVIVVDNSKNMTNINLELIFSNIMELFAEKTRIGTNYDDPRTTRVALVTYNQDATVVADLNQYQSIQDLHDGAENALSIAATTDQSFLAKGLTAAEQVLASGRANNYRHNYKQLIIVYANTYQTTNQSDPVVVANRLKNKSIKIATVDMTSIDDDYHLYTQLSAIATDNMYTTQNSLTTYNTMNAIFRTNCYCRDTWINFEEQYLNPGSGVCVKMIDTKTSWQVAKVSCQSTIANSYLVTDFTADKHQFLLDLYQNTTGYHIGLTYVNGGWFWQQPVGQQLLPLTGTPEWLFWNTGYPRSQTTKTGVATLTDGSQTGWENIDAHNVMENYICEVDACDTDTYCP